MDDTERIVRTFNDLQNRGVIKGYALIGAVGANFWNLSLATVDTDVAVLVESDEEFFDDVWLK